MRRSHIDLIESLDFLSGKLGPLPIINRFFDRLHIDRLLDEFVPHTDRRVTLPPATGLGVLIRNILVAREPIYGMAEWASRHDEGVLRLPAGGVKLLNDDRVGRCLDRLFQADRAGLATALVTRAQQRFDLDLEQLHNDTTTITFHGKYENANGDDHFGMPTCRITRGYNKDHRPDLKQLVYALTTTADGAVPVWCSLEDGNITDDQTHIGTWDSLCRLVGDSDFRYVADSKLCTTENMDHIAKGRGRFVTVLPKTRKEDAWFRDWIQTHDVPWQELVRRPNSRRKDGPDEVYRGFESPRRSAEGYRIIWYWSSQKSEQDRESRQNRIDRALRELQQVQERMASPRSRLTTEGKVHDEAAKLLAECNATRWIEIVVNTTHESYFRQDKPGRPGKDTKYVRQARKKLDLVWSSNEKTLQYDSRTDGIFPLIVNESEDDLSPRDALLAYKHQPHLERRFHELKSIAEVMPVMLHNPARIEAFLFVYFIALFVDAIIEREIRRRMKADALRSLPLYAEGRACTAPTADRIFSLFGDIRRHALVDPDDQVVRWLYDDLSSTHRTVLRLFSIPTAKYFSDGQADA